MKVALPLEVVDLILSRSIHQEAPQLDAHPSSSTASSCHREQVIDVGQAVSVSLLSKHCRARFQPTLYRHVILSTNKATVSFSHTVRARSDLAAVVRSLAIFADVVDQKRPASAAPSGEAASHGIPHQEAVDLEAADAILSACSKITHLFVSCDLFSNLRQGMYLLHRPKEVTLVNVTHAAQIDGIVTRHRDLTTAILREDPRMQAILGSHSSHLDDATPITALQSASAATMLPEQVQVEPSAQRSLSHLHLVNFDGRLLHHLATVSSLTYLVLTNPLIPDSRPGVPGLSIIPRSHLMLLLGSGNIARILIRADLATCIRLMDELAPIDDGKLMFRPICKLGDALFANRLRAEVTDSLGHQVSALYDSVVANNLDLLAEFLGRVRLSLQLSGFSSPSSSADPDLSRDSSGRGSQGRSFDGSARTASHSGEDGGSDEFEEEVSQEGSPGPSTMPTSDLSPATNTSINAPPLNIPIEELLRSEGFKPIGPASNIASSQASSTEPSTASSRRRFHRQLLRRGPFAVRRTDLRGAIQANLNICEELYDALAAEAGIGQEMTFW